MGQAALVVAGFLPRVAEVYINSCSFFIGRKKRIKLFNVIRKQIYVFHGLLAELRFNVAAGNAQNIFTDVDADEIHVFFSVRKLCQKRAFAAAKV